MKKLLFILLIAPCFLKAQEDDSVFIKVCWCPAMLTSNSEYHDSIELYFNNRYKYNHDVPNTVSNIRMGDYTALTAYAGPTATMNPTYRVLDTAIIFHGIDTITHNHQWLEKKVDKFIGFHSLNYNIYPDQSLRSPQPSFPSYVTPSETAKTDLIDKEVICFICLQNFTINERVVDKFKEAKNRLALIQNISFGYSSSYLNTTGSNITPLGKKSLKRCTKKK